MRGGNDTRLYATRHSNRFSLRDMVPVVSWKFEAVGVHAGDNKGDTPMSYTETKGNLFNSSAQCLVNTVNCVGVMGKGVALEFRRRFPEMFEVYRQVCAEGRLKPGQILPYLKGAPWVLNFAVKNDWKFPSRMEWVESCLRKFASHYTQLGIHSIAIPWIGAMNGGLPWGEVHNLMRTHLQPLPNIDIEVVEFDPDAPDPVFSRLREALGTLGTEEFADLTEIQPRMARFIHQAVVEEHEPSLARLCARPGLGETTIERIYASFRTARHSARARQLTLFA